MCKSDPRKLEDLKSVYLAVFNRPLLITGCSNCIQDSIIELSIQLNKYDNPHKYKKMTKEEGKYKLKPGIIIDLTYSTGEYITESNVTDDKIRKLIKLNPAYLNFLESYPEDEVEKILADNKKPEVKKEVLKAEVKKPEPGKVSLKKVKESDKKQT